MHDLISLTPLGGSTPRIETFDHITVAENDTFAMASVAARRAFEPKCHSKLNDLLGTFPGPNKAVFKGPEESFWMGPDQWMITAPKDTHELLAETLTTHFGDTASVTEQSGAWVCFDLAGPGIADVTERLCAAPVRKMTSGDATRTLIHQLGCFVIRGQGEQQLRIFGPRASAGTLHHALLTAAISTS